MEIAETEVIHHFIRKHLLEGHREPWEPGHLQQQKPSFGQLSERLKLQGRALPPASVRCVRYSAATRWSPPPTASSAAACTGPACARGQSIWVHTRAPARHSSVSHTATGTERLLIKP